MSKINYNTDVEYDTDEKKFRITRGMVILAGIIILVVTIIVVLVVNITNKRKEMWLFVCSVVSAVSSVFRPVYSAPSVCSWEGGIRPVGVVPKCLEYARVKEE